MYSSLVQFKYCFQSVLRGTLSLTEDVLNEFRTVSTLVKNFLEKAVIVLIKLNLQYLYVTISTLRSSSGVRVLY